MERTAKAMPVAKYVGLVSDNTTVLYVLSDGRLNCAWNCEARAC